MKKQIRKSQIITLCILVALVIGTVLAVFGLSRAIKGVDEIAISKTPEAILASAGVSEESNISLPVLYFDQKADDCVNLYDNGSRKALAARQFEWTSCKNNKREIERGMVKYELGDDYLPVAVGGKLTTNLGLSDMKRWFSAVEGKSQAHSGMINLKYRSDGAEFLYHNNDFYPIDNVKFSANDTVNNDGHNHLFTMSLAIPFTVMASGDESFEIAADDDTFVFLGDKLVIDMGGIHDTTNAKLVIRENGEIYTTDLGNDLAYSGIELEKGKETIIRIFHADRDSSSSVFKLKMTGMNLNVMQTEIAGVGSGMQVAYDPNDPSFVAPLGQTSVVSPDGTRGLIVLATVEGVLVVVFMVLIALMAHSMIKKKA